MALRFEKDRQSENSEEIPIKDLDKNTAMGRLDGKIAIITGAAGYLLTHF